MTHYCRCPPSDLAAELGVVVVSLFELFGLGSIDVPLPFERESEEFVGAGVELPVAISLRFLRLLSFAHLSERGTSLEVSPSSLQWLAADGLPVVVCMVFAFAGGPALLLLSPVEWLEGLAGVVVEVELGLDEDVWVESDEGDCVESVLLVDRPLLLVLFSPPVELARFG